MSIRDEFVVDSGETGGLKSAIAWSEKSWIQGFRIARNETAPVDAAVSLA